MWGDWCSGGRVGDGASGALQLQVRLASRRIERRILRIDPSAPSADPFGAGCSASLSFAEGRLRHRRRPARGEYGLSPVCL